MSKFAHFDDSRINNASKNEKFLPDITSYHDLEDHSSLSIQKELIEFETENLENEDEVVEEKEIVNLEVSSDYKTGNKFRPIGNMSISTIKNRTINNSNNTLNFLSDTYNQNTSSIKKLNSMIILEKVFSRMTSNEKIEAEKSNESQIKQPNPVNNKLVMEKITFKRRKPKEYFISKHRNYCIIKCDTITTFFVENFVFSKFSHPNFVEKDKNVNLTFLMREKIDSKFQVPDNLVDILKLEANMNKSPISREQFNTFMNGLNEFFDLEEFVEIIGRFSKKKFIFLGICALILVIIAVMTAVLISCNFFISDNEEDSSSFWTTIIGFSLITIFLIIGFIRFLIYAFVDNNYLRTYDIYMFHIKNYNKLDAYFEKWNVELFIPNAIYVSTPVTMDYLQFNLNPFKEIELEHHEIGHGEKL